MIRSYFCSISRIFFLSASFISSKDEGING
jgi:hypothetical protein